MQRNLQISDPNFRENSHVENKGTPVESVLHLPTQPLSSDTLRSYEQDDRVLLPVPSEFNSAILIPQTESLCAESGIEESPSKNFTQETVIAACNYQSSSSISSKYDSVIHLPLSGKIIKQKEEQTQKEEEFKIVFSNQEFSELLYSGGRESHNDSSGSGFRYGRFTGGFFPREVYGLAGGAKRSKDPFQDQEQRKKIEAQRRIEENKRKLEERIEKKQKEEARKQKEAQRRAEEKKRAKLQEQKALKEREKLKKLEEEKERERMLSSLQNQQNDQKQEIIAPSNQEKKDSPLRAELIEGRSINYRDQFLHPKSAELLDQVMGRISPHSRQIQRIVALQTHSGENYSQNIKDEESASITSGPLLYSETTPEVQHGQFESPIPKSQLKSRHQESQIKPPDRGSSYIVERPAAAAGTGSGSDLHSFPSLNQQRRNRQEILASLESQTHLDTVIQNDHRLDSSPRIQFEVDQSHSDEEEVKTAQYIPDQKPTYQDTPGSSLYTEEIPSQPENSRPLNVRKFQYAQSSESEGHEVESPLRESVKYQPKQEEVPPVSSPPSAFFLTQSQLGFYKRPQTDIVTPLQRYFPQSDGLLRKSANQKPQQNRLFEERKESQVPKESHVQRRESQMSRKGSQSGLNKTEISKKERMLIKLEVASGMKQVQKQLSTKEMDQQSQRKKLREEILSQLISQGSKVKLEGVSQKKETIHEELYPLKEEEAKESQSQGSEDAQNMEFQKIEEEVKRQFDPEEKPSQESVSFVNIGGVVGQGRVPTGYQLSDPKVSEVAEEVGVQEPPNDIQAISSGKHFEETEGTKRKAWEKAVLPIQTEKELSMTDVLGDAGTFSQSIVEAGGTGTQLEQLKEQDEIKEQEPETSAKQEQEKSEITVTSSNKPGKGELMVFDFDDDKDAQARKDKFIAMRLKKEQKAKQMKLDRQKSRERRQAEAGESTDPKSVRSSMKSRLQNRALKSPSPHQIRSTASQKKIRPFRKQQKSPVSVQQEQVSIMSDRLTQDIKSIPAAQIKEEVQLNFMSPLHTSENVGALYDDEMETPTVSGALQTQMQFNIKSEKTRNKSKGKPPAPKKKFIHQPEHYQEEEKKSRGKDEKYHLSPSPLHKGYSTTGNKKLIINAIKQVCMASETNRKERDELLSLLSARKDANFIILFKQAVGRQDFKALYSFDIQNSEILKIWGPVSAPSQLTDKMIQKYYRYDSGSRQFKEIVGNKSFSRIVTAVGLIQVKK